MLLSVLQDLPEYRCIVFQKDRSNEDGNDDMDKRFEDLKKFIDKRTKTLCANHEGVSNKLNDIFKRQQELSESMIN
jgi:hypothetical protein